MTEAKPVSLDTLNWLKSLGPLTAAQVEERLADGRWVQKSEQTGVCGNGSKN